jgi:diaminopropionate ammonia-lyase
MSRYIANPYFQPETFWAQALIEAFEADDIGELHRSLIEYRPTPLIELPGLAGKLGVGRVAVKDESHRFGLKAFKALGATYACYRFVKDYLRERGRACPPAAEFYRSTDILRPGEVTFCTATDGNHGRGVAWTARKLGQLAVIYMPLGTVPARIENIRNEGAEVRVVDGNYDAAVTRCAEDATTNGWQIISDTSWSGYEQIPRRIMAGYLTLFREIAAVTGANDRFDIVLVPGGVGALAGAAAFYYRRETASPQTRLVAVEPLEAACLLESIESPGGEPVVAGGRLDSIMAGLNCGLASPVSWPLIKSGFDAFLAVSDDACVEAVRTYRRPEPGDPRLISGESGAATLAGLLALVGDDMAEARGQLGVGPVSSILLLSTEGDTDPVGYQRIVTSIE